MSKRYRRTNDTIFEESLYNNMQDYYNFENRLIDLAVGRFTIKNLPKEIYEPYVIRTLVCRNEILFFKDDITDEFIAYEFTTNGAKLDRYCRPTERRVYCPNGYNRNDLNDTNSVIIKGSNSGTGIMPIIQQYARKLFNISRTIDTNVSAQKTPVLILCDENERLSFENIYKDYIGNAPVIKGTRDLNIDGIKALSTGAPFVADKLYELQTSLWNEYLTFLGVPNVAEKKERMVTDEVTRLMGGVMVARNNFVKAIERGLNEVNEMFGLELELEFIGEMETGEDDRQDETEERTEDNE